MTINATAAPRNDRPVESAVQPCPLLHWFDLRMKFAPPPEARPKWWPVERRSGYPDEKVSITAAGVAPPLRRLDGSGRVRVDNIPAGKAQVVFYQVLADVRQAFERGTAYAPR
jgi:hypothetical protein